MKDQIVGEIFRWLPKQSEKRSFSVPTHYGKEFWAHYR